MIWDAPERRGGCFSLPSVDAAAALVSGDLSVMPKVAWYTFVRGIMIAAGLAAVGRRDASGIAKDAAAGTVAVEVWVLLWAWRHRETLRVR